MLADGAHWSATPYSVAAAAAIAEALGLSITVASILVRRGYGTPDAARAFLAGADRHDPSGLHDIEAACETILRHAGRGSPIVVHGDYDVDGVASTAVLVRALRSLGARVSWHLPSRLDEGYGLSRATVARLAAEGAALLVTVDCGITSAEEVELARASGLEVVVTDHHRPPERLPSCPIVHPALGGYPFPDLCAAGVAHKLAEALYARAGLDPARADEDIDLVALATVADLVPLRGENRRLVREGLRAIARTRKPGLRALMKVAALDPGEVDARALAFRLAPRINAAGRLQRADAGLELLLTEDEGRAAEVADELDLLNRERRDTELRILAAAEAERARHDGEAAYVLAGEGWHPGVIGIVASRIVERHHRPTLLVALDGDSGRGSGRSIPPYDLHAGLAACSAHLVRFGGHRAAAGFEIAAGEVDALRREFVTHAASALTPGDLIREQRVDAVVPGTSLGLGLAEELGRLEPFGQGNPEPVLLVPAARLGDARAMGEEGKHCRFTLTSAGVRARAVAFGTTAGSISRCGDEPFDSAVTLELNEWNGTVEPRVVLRAACALEKGACELLGGEEEFWDAFERAPAGYDGSAGDPAAAVSGEPPAAVPAERTLACQDRAAGEPSAPVSPPRELRDRRGEGFAGLAADLIASGEPVAIVCADVPRRRAGIEAVLGSRGAPLVSWPALRERPGLAAPFRHLIALDPPPTPVEEALLRRAPGGGVSHLAWGEPEVAFTLALAEAELELRPALTEVYRALRAAGSADGEVLRGMLCGAGRHPRSAAHCAALVRVLAELGLASYSERRCLLVPGTRAELASAPTYARAQERLAAIRAHLAGAQPGAERAAA